MAVSSTVPLPEKDFKAVLGADGRIQKIGIDFFDSAVTAQPLYLLQQKDWNIWKAAISDFCARGECSCYAETAFNTVSGMCKIYPLDVKNLLCQEIDTPEDLKTIRTILKDVE